MSKSMEGPSATVAAPAQPQPKLQPAAGHPSGFPMCRCGHPTHPHRLERRRGVMMERYVCPRQRWWNNWWHTDHWLPPRD